MALPSDPHQALQQARRDPDMVVLEGLHPLKHALRFGAQIPRVMITDPGRVEGLIALYAPDLPELLSTKPEIVSEQTFKSFSPHTPATGVMSIAIRPEIDVGGLLADPRPEPVVLLEAPRDLGNIGACVRVAAAADVAGLLTTGVNDPWDPAALRGSAGLHYALPVARITEIHGDGDRQLIAVDPEGDQVSPTELPPRSILAFGSERQGLSAELLEAADARVSLPMRQGVSSLNLATSVAALLYAWRVSGGR